MKATEACALFHVNLFSGMHCAPGTFYVMAKFTYVLPLFGVL